MTIEWTLVHHQEVAAIAVADQLSRRQESSSFALRQWLLLPREFESGSPLASAAAASAI